MENVLQIQAAFDVWLNVRYLPGGSAPDGHEADRSMVEFYDARRLDTEFGQFISRYSIDMFLASEDGGAEYEHMANGMDLYGRKADWSIQGEELREVCRWVRTLHHPT